MRRRVPGSAVLGLAVCLIAVVALIWTMPKDEADRRTYAIAEGDTWFTWRDLQVRQVRTQVVTSVAGRYGDPVAAEPDAAFVVVDYQVRSLREPVALTHQLVLGDLRVDAFTRLSQLPAEQAQPGFTQTGTVVYQVPRAKLPARALSALQRPTRGLVSYSELPALRLELGQPVNALAEPAEATTEVTR
ncbi:hypothetical protein [Enemella evansiae]|uniref:hypothetical protein n=1 Tax=Enemella evansiae TaxID=2016499 RepID=UPI00117D8D62|nr:hypothetical protein [Enemella evansiae]